MRTKVRRLPIRRSQKGAAAGLLAGLLLGSTGCGGGAGKPGATPGPAPKQAATQIRWEDVSGSVGLRFSHYNGADGRFFMPESVGSGGAFLDYDGDGWLDILLVNGQNWPDRPKSNQTLALYRNGGDGSFKDVTRAAGLDTSMYGLGCAVGDFDNDGHDDVLITGMGPNRLFRNTGAGRFQDVTSASGLGKAEKWDYHTSAAWFDYDRDGLLDLFTCRYVDWSPQKDVPCRSGSGKRIYCGPNQYPPVKSRLYRNVGRGRFQDVSAATGISSVTGKALGVLPIDENGDGWTDLLVTNDTTPNHLFRNEGGKRFSEVAQEAGVAVDENGRARAGMGVDVADVRNDGGLAFSIGNFSQEGLSLYERTEGLFMDVAGGAGLTPSSLHNVTFGLTFLDADRDGQQDLFTYNGHVDPHAEEAGGAVTYRQKPQFFRNEGGSFREIGAETGETFRLPQVGRGCAWGDYNNDGRPDLLLFENAGPARLLRNASSDSHPWLGVRLKGARGNRNAYGAEVRLTAGGVTQRRWVRSGGSYLSHSDTRALFGLGVATSVERLEVRWPSGSSTVLEHPKLGAYLEVTEPAAP